MWILYYFDPDDNSWESESFESGDNAFQRKIELQATGFTDVRLEAPNRQVFV